MFFSSVTSGPDPFQFSVQQCCQSIVCELGTGSSPTSITQLLANRVIVEKSLECLHHSCDISGLFDDDARLTIDHGFGGTATATGDDWHSASCGFKKHNSETFLFESCPTIAAQHCEHVSRAQQRNKISVIHAP